KNRCGLRGMHQSGCGLCPNVELHLLNQQALQNTLQACLQIKKCQLPIGVLLPQPLLDAPNDNRKARLLLVALRAFSEDLSEFEQTAVRNSMAVVVQEIFQ